MTKEIDQDQYKVNPNRWCAVTEINQDQCKVNPDKWVISTKKHNNSKKKYFFLLSTFVVGLIFVSVIKNETRKLQKEINNLRASINSINFNLHQAVLDYDVITSPENISLLAKTYLNTDFVTYKKNQIKSLKEKEIDLVKLEKKDYKKSEHVLDKTKLLVAKKIEIKKKELRKLQELYSKPQNLPKELKFKVAKKIEKVKDQIKVLYTSPKNSDESRRVQRWAAIQVVKVLFGMPVIPGK